MSLLRRLAGVVVFVPGVLLTCVGKRGSGNRASAVCRSSAVAALAGLLSMVGAASAAADTCPNAQFRTGYGANLPDCRAYEQVSPSDKGHNDVEPFPIFSAAGGNTVAYGSTGAFAGSPADGAFNGYAGARSANLWLTTPLDAPLTAGFLTATFEAGASADLTREMVETNAALVPGAVTGNMNLYVHNTTDGSYGLVATNPDGADFGQTTFSFAGASADGNRWFFSLDQRYALDSAPPPPNGAPTNLYGWFNGALQLIGILPDGSVDPSGSIQAAPGSPSVAFRPVSEDGSRVYWTEPQSFGGSAGVAPVYLRQVDQGQTKLVSKRESDGSAQPATFWYATTDGSEAFITSDAQLTDTASPAGNDLYRYDAASGQLTDLTPDRADPGGADITGVLGVSEDGAYVYFVARGALTPDASADMTNLYVKHGDDPPRLIGALASNDFEITAPLNTNGLGLGGGGGAAGWRVSPNGHYLGFTFDGQITGQHPQDAEAFQQAYLYDYAAGSLICASCTGTAQPSGNVSFIGPFFFTTAFGTYQGTEREVTDSGQFFFDSPDPLVSQDSNGKLDVYEYEGGQTRLISSGRGDANSYFGDASADGADVLFITRDRLVGQDGDDSYDLYDARVNGGLAGQNPPAAPTPCGGDACKGPPSAGPSAPLAASVTFFGPGNASAPATASVVTRVVHGTSFLISVSAPAKGRITIGGAAIRTVSRAVATAGTYRLRIRLTSRGRRALASTRMLKLRLRVHYEPSSGPASVANVTLTVKPALKRGQRSKARQANRYHGGPR